MQIHIFYFIYFKSAQEKKGNLFGILGVLFGVPGVLVGVLGVWWFVWRTLYIFWRNWCLWYWDVVFVTFRIWDGASIFITKNVIL